MKIILYADISICIRVFMYFILTVDYSDEIVSRDMRGFISPGGSVANFHGGDTYYRYRKF